MNDELRHQDRDLIRAKINLETARIPWRELQRFFAAGKVMRVAAGLDLVEVAVCIEQDDLGPVEAWIANGELHPVDDAEARRWIADDALLWAVVVKPWVLVQTLETNS